MEHKLTLAFADVITSLQGYKDKFEEIESNNKKLNDDILALEKEKSVGYTSFNTETHILVEKDALNCIKSDLEDARSSASYASEEASSGETCMEEARGSADSAEDSARYGIDKIDEIFNEARKENNQNG